MTTVYLANKYPQAQLAAVEPDASAFALLRLNTAHLKQVGGRAKRKHHNRIPAGSSLCMAQMCSWVCVAPGPAACTAAMHFLQPYGIQYSIL